MTGAWGAGVLGCWGSPCVPFKLASGSEQNLLFPSRVRVPHHALGSPSQGFYAFR